MNILTKNAKAFVDANSITPVVSGAVKGKGGEGGSYILADGRIFSLSLEDCRSLPEGYPKWPWDYNINV